MPDYGKDTIRVAVNSRIGALLREYAVNSGEQVTDIFLQAVIDYIFLLKHVKSKKPDNDLKKAFLTSEMKSQVILDRIAELRKEYCQVRRKEAILLEVPLPKRDNGNYINLPIPVFLHGYIKKMLKKNPNLYNKRTTIKDVLDRAVLFRVIKNEELFNNKAYREWRVSLLMAKECESKFELEEVVEKISVREKIRWK